MFLKSIIKNLQESDWVKLLLKQSQIYLVGGCVRDYYLNKPIKDIDLVVVGLPLEKIQSLLKVYGKVNIVGQTFSVLKFSPRDRKNEEYDIAIPRKDVKTGEGHKGFSVKTEGVTMHEDLKRRDFTINSIAVNIKTLQKLDPFRGVEDIKNKILRATDQNAFIEDPLRLIRCIQFSSRFNFDIEENTKILMKKNAHLIRQISGERILEEFEKLLHKGGNVKKVFEIMYQTDIDKALFGNKFIQNDFSNLEHLDPISFYFVLATLGNKNPTEFYSQRLRGEYNMTKALQTLDKYFDKFSGNEEDIKWNVFLMLKNSPQLENSVILPNNVIDIIEDMKNGNIPMKLGDIPVNGNDIMEKFDISGEEVGERIYKMYKDALMNRFDWKSKEATLKYLETLN